MTDLFFYGTLRHLPLLELVLGRPLSELTIYSASLRDHAVYGVKEQAFPMILQEANSIATGVVAHGLSTEDLKRLTYYEGGFDYDLRLRIVERDDGSTVEASVFYPQPDLWTPDRPWSLQEWAEKWGEVSVLAAEEVMAHYGRVDAAKIARSFPAIRTRAWARLAARHRKGVDQRDIQQDVVLHCHTRAYVDYFGMDEVDLQHRKNDGEMGPVLHRSGLMQGAAVIVLPYDPVRDTVLLIEQFRAPVYLIDDPEPWMWEPVAGMIDPGETPEQTAHRETQEEAQITLTNLEYAGGAYTSSGTSTEYAYLYIGLGDLTETVECGGLATEGEDIRSKILPFDDFMSRVEAHDFKNLPLLMLAHWLARHRDRLRG